MIVGWLSIFEQLKEFCYILILDCVTISVKNIDIWISVRDMISGLLSEYCQKGRFFKNAIDHYSYISLKDIIPTQLFGFRRSLLVFDGCSPELGGTIILQGETRDTLVKLKGTNTHEWNC